MSRHKEAKTSLANYLFSQNGDDSRGLSAEHSYNQMLEGDEQFNFNIPHEGKQWQSNDNIPFLKMNGPCVQFSQNYSQNSMIYSHRQDDDSRDQKNDSNHYMRMLQIKKKEEIQFNLALQQELNQIKKQRDRMQLENCKLQTLNKGLECKVREREKNIQILEQQISNFEQQIQKLKMQNQNYLKTQIHRSSCLQEYKKQSQKILVQLAEKQKENNLLKNDIAYLEKQIEKLSHNLSIYNQPDRKLHDFRGVFSSQSYEVPVGLKKNSTMDKQIEKIRKEKNLLQVQLSTLKDKLQDREVRSKQIQEQNKKKILLKQKRINELQQRINEFKEEQMKFKTQNQVSVQKLTNSVTLKNKEITSLSQKNMENQRRIKSLLQESKKKDEKIKEVNLELLQKNRHIVQNEKTIQQMRVKLEFDNQMIEDKDKQIEKLFAQKKVLKTQIENNEKIQKSDRMDKNQRQKAKRQVDKLKKQLEAAKKEIENAKKQIEDAKKQIEDTKKQIEDTKKQIEDAKKQIEDLTKENQSLQNVVKQSKKKLQQALKKIQQLRNTNSQLEEESRKREEQSANQYQAKEKAVRQLNEYKKRNQSVAEMKNKIILLQSRLKAKSEKQTGQSFDCSTLQERIDLLQHKLQEKDRQNRALKAKIKNEAKNSDYQLKQLEQQITQRQNQIETLLKQNQQLKKQLAFKEQTLDFTHKILVNSQKAKIQLEQQKKMLEEMIHGQREESFDSTNYGTNQQLSKFYQQKIEQLELMLKKKEDEHRFDVKQLKQRVRQLNDMLLNKQRRITPETMSPQDTVNFLIKTIKKVNKSTDMLRVLSKNVQFREGLTRMDRQFRK